MSRRYYFKRKIAVDVLKLVSAIKKHDCLWNPESIHFKRGSMTIRAWMEVADEMGKEESFLRAKWKNLKDNYRKELKKNYIDGEYRGVWQHFEHLDFLRNSVTGELTERAEEGTYSDDEFNEDAAEVTYKRTEGIDNTSCMKLIEEIKKHECLWKMKRCPFRKSATAWTEVSEKLGKPISYLTKKWKNLKYTYKKEILKNYVDGDYQGLWPYFEAMDFLRNYVTNDLKERAEGETFSDDETNEAGIRLGRKPDSRCIKFLEEIEKHECLWKKSRYPNMTLRIRAWKEISEKLGLSIPLLRRRWNYMKTTYKKEVLINYDDCEGVYKGTWSYFDMMNFVAVDDLTEDNNEETLSEEEQSEPEILYEQQFESDTEDQVKEEDNADYSETYLEDPIPEKKPRMELEDSDLMFLKSLVPFFRGLDPVRKLVLRSKIQDTVMKELASSS